MNLKLNKTWGILLNRLNKKNGHDLTMSSILFLIGLQEMGFVNKKLNKQQKLEVIHNGLCVVLSKKGYYKLNHKDSDGWFHWNNIKPLPKITEKEQEILIKKMIIEYFS